MENKVCRLKKTIYGLEQSSHNWFYKHTNTLKQLGFTRWKADYSLFSNINQHGSVFIIVYVDDIIIACDNQHTIAQLKATVHDKFQLKDLAS